MSINSDDEMLGIRREVSNIIFQLIFFYTLQLYLKQFHRMQQLTRKSAIASLNRLSTSFSVEQERRHDKKISNFGVWNEKEQEKYIMFLEFFYSEMTNQHMRKMLKVFKRMGTFIGTRDGMQCRSHHMKQLKTHHSIQDIIEAYKSRQTASYQLKYQENYERLTLMKQSIFSNEIQNTPEPQRTIELNQSLIQTPQQPFIQLPSNLDYHHQFQNPNFSSPENSTQPLYYWVVFLHNQDQNKQF